VGGAGAGERGATARRVTGDVGGAFAAGEIGYGHVRQISATAGEVASEVVAESESILVDAARTLDPRGLGKVIAHWRHARRVHRSRS
jgi:hypothetical protein